MASYSGTLFRPHQFLTKASDRALPVICIADALWHIEISSGSIEYFIDVAILVGFFWKKRIPVQQSRMRDYTINDYKGSSSPIDPSSVSP